MKEIFREGDVVELLPYDDVKDHCGIRRHSWEAVRDQNPLVIASASGRAVYLKGIGYFFKPSAFARYYEPILAPVEDLL